MDGYILSIVCGYLLGSIPTGKLVGWRFGIDIQKKGSGNIGFANTLRVLGWRPALMVLFGDSSKAFLAVLIAQKLELPVLYICLTGFSVLLGNLHPVWLRFKGGKGVATGLGITLAISPLLGCLGLTAYIVAISFFKKSAIASILSAWTLPILSSFIAPEFVVFFLCLAILSVWTHRTNIRQMRKDHVRGR